MKNNKNNNKVYYSNTDILKVQILKDNKDKSGIYRWINLITGESYIGSSKSLSNRFSKYYSINFLKNFLENRSSLIYKNLLEYGYSHFGLEILEYCEIDKLILREQFYLDLLAPKYNILKIAGSRLGSKHSLETRKLISNTLKNHLIKITPIQVTDIQTNTIKSFPNNLETAKYLGISVRTLSRYKSNKSILLKRYLITNNIEKHKSYK